jgi:hypothetical protein
MNPYEPPHSDPSGWRKRGIHGGMAAVLLLGAMIIRFGIPLFMQTSYAESGMQPLLLLLSLIGAIAWLWGCCHLALHFGLSMAWGFFGLLFLVGPFVIFWAAHQKPKWDMAAARRPQRKNEYRGDPDSLY